MAWDVHDPAVRSLEIARVGIGGGAVKLRLADDPDPPGSPIVPRVDPLSSVEDLGALVLLAPEARVGAMRLAAGHQRVLPWSRATSRRAWIVSR
jgi:hypothetical protein